MSARTQSFLGLDQGSGATKAILLDENGSVLFSSVRKVDTSDFGDGRVEQDPGQIRDSVHDLAGEAVAFAEASHCDIASIGIALQRSGTCAWNEEGEPLSPFLSWRDQREIGTIDKLADHHERITALTGLPVNGHYAASKLAWLRKHYPDPAIKIGTLDSFLRWSWNPEIKFATEDTMAARTLLYSLEHRRWEPELCTLFGVSIAELPAIVPTISLHGTLFGKPIMACIGDQQSALHGRGAHETLPVLNLGTISSLCLSGIELSRAPRGFVASVLRSELEGERCRRHFLVEGISNSSGRIFSEILSSPALSADLAQLDPLIEGISDAPVGFFPLGGTATPDWKLNLPSVIASSEAPSPRQLARSMIEHLAFSIVIQCRILEKEGALSGKIVSIGGGYSRCRTLLSTIASLTGFTLLVPAEREATAIGAAILAARAVRADCQTPAEISARISFPRSEILNEKFRKWNELRIRVLNQNLAPHERAIDTKAILHDQG